MNTAKKLVSTALLALLFVAANVSAHERSYINGSSAADSKSAPFSGAVKTDGTLYLSGMLGLENGKVPAEASQEARNILNAMKATLEEAGMTMDDLVYVQIFASDLSDYAAFNKAYREFFTKEFPARAFIGAGSLLFDARFEIQAIAVAR
jgi:2-iminobutanoate/2-iminopropanoate deaminase